MKPLPLVLTLLAGLVSACGPTEGPITYAEAPDPLAVSGVHPLTLDISVPDPEVHGEGPFPAIVWIHGGGWRYGDLYDGFGKDVLAKAPERGFVGLSINYRLTLQEDEDGAPRFPWPAQIEDSRCAIRWLSSHSDEYGVDTDLVGVAGYSGGAHLALLLAEAPEQTRWDAAFCEHDGSAEVAAAFSRSGPTDLVQLWDTTTDLGREWAGLALGVSEESAAADISVLEEVSPLSYVDEDDTVPLHLDQGLDDEMVVASTTPGFVDAVHDAGQPIELVEYTDQDHSWGGSSSDHSIEEMYRFHERELLGETAAVSCSPWPDCED